MLGFQISSVIQAGVPLGLSTYTCWVVQTLGFDNLSSSIILVDISFAEAISFFVEDQVIVLFQLISVGYFALWNPVRTACRKWVSCTYCAASRVKACCRTLFMVERIKSIFFSYQKSKKKILTD